MMLPGHRRRRACLSTLALPVLLSLTANAAADPLPAWRDGAAKTRLQDFVAEVTTPGGRGYVTPVERIAVFGDDGTLWPEKPRVQGMFALQRLRALAPSRPEWQNLMPYKAALELGTKYLTEATDEALMQILVATHAGQTQDEFRAEARNFLATARHPAFNRPYPQLAYQPMRELIAWLRANGFRIFVVTAGSVDFVRLLAEEAYGIPPDDVVGSSVLTNLQEEDGLLVIRRLDRPHALNDGPVKPISIDLQIGRRPIFAAGNIGSGGDIEMLRYSQDGRRPSLQLLLNHDDFQREFAYDERNRASLNAAEQHGWLVVSMRYGWRRIFSFQRDEAPVPAGAPESP